MNAVIKAEDIRKGDRVREVREYVSVVDGEPFDVDQEGRTFELIERPVTLPTVPGYYLDKHKDMWQLTAPNNRWFCLADTKYDYREAEYAPFTLLRPVAEVAAEVLAEVRKGYNTDDPTYWGKLDALAAKWATK